MTQHENTEQSPQEVEVSSPNDVTATDQPIAHAEEVPVEPANDALYQVTLLVTGVIGAVQFQEYVSVRYSAPKQLIGAHVDDLFRHAQEVVHGRLPNAQIVGTHIITLISLAA